MSDATDRPAPPVPDDADLKDFAFTPIYRARLFGSAFHARATDAEWRAGVTLWLKSWDQVPAGSLPDDDVDLCRLAELGRDMKTWRKIKAGAMRGWMLCSDGRWYHRVVAEVVLEAWEKRATASRKGKAGALKRWGTGNATTTKENSTGIAGAMPGDSKGQGQGQGEQPSSLRSDGAAPQLALVPLPTVEPKRVVFGECLAWLIAASGKPDAVCRKLLGQWCRDHGEPAVIQAFQAASRDPPAGDAVAWVTGILKQGQRNGTGHRGRAHGSPSPHEALLDAAVAAVALVRGRVHDEG